MLVLMIWSFLGVKGRGSLMFQKDLKRSYGQYPICLGDLSKVGFQWIGPLFEEMVLPMGLRSIAQICQRVTTAIAYMLGNFCY